jgi:hypothetical protein
VFKPLNRLVFLSLLIVPRAHAAMSPVPVHIHRIIVNRHNVFNTGTPRDHRFPYSWGNKLHIVTQEAFIRNELLFKEGDVLDTDALEESERLLRRREIFRYVRITTQESGPGTVDVLVETDDVWTTAIDASFSLAGGQTSYRAGVLEQNFLGLGRTVGAFVRKDIDRTTRGVSYQNPHFLHRRLNLFGGYGRDEKGKEWETSIERPFFSALTRLSFGASLRDREDEDRFFRDGDESATFAHNERQGRAFGSYALVAEPKRVRRVLVMYENEVDTFSNAAGPDAPLLPARRQVAPILTGLDFENLRYRKVRGVTTFDRDEDINTGFLWDVDAGPYQKKWGSTENGWLGRLQADKNLVSDSETVWFNRIVADGRLENGHVQNGTGRLQSHLFWPDWRPRHTASIKGEYMASSNLDPERQLLLGGENGLRGYSVRQFSGSNKLLMTLEDRRFWLPDWLDLVNLGWAYFVDSGAVWNRGWSPRGSDIRSDVGVGIRIAPSRSVHAGLIRMDVAYALQDNRRSSRFVVNIGADIDFGEPRQPKFEQ